MADRVLGALKWSIVVSYAVAMVAACGSGQGASNGGEGTVPDGGNPNDPGIVNNGSQITTCKPLSCADQALECGPAGDGCSNIIQCGTCADGLRCGGPGAPSKCVAPNGDGGVCTPRTCADQGLESGPSGDGCGGVIECGTCSGGQQCGSDTAYAKCVTVIPVGVDGGACVPFTCDDYKAKGMD